MDKELLFKIRMVAQDKALEAGDPTLFKETYMTMKHTLREGSKKEADDLKDELKKYKFKNERLEKLNGLHVQSFHGKARQQG